MMSYVKLLFVAIFWGGTFIAGRTVAQHVGPFSAAFLRFAVASLFLIFVTRKLEGGIPPLKKHQIVPILLLGMTGVFLYNIFFLSGLKTVEAGRASLIIATNPIFIALLAYSFFRERLTGINMAGILLCASGAIIVISKGNLRMIMEGGIGTGELYILGCVVSWVLYSLVGKRIMKDMSPLVAVTYSCLIGGTLLFLPAIAEGMLNHLWSYRGADWFSIFYLGFFGTALGFTWYYEGIKKLGVSKAAVFINFVPISAVIMASLILKEKIDLSLVIGAVMVIGGAWFTNRK
jgi:drug/metabolite transporter (DMT)-like permease